MTDTLTVARDGQPGIIIVTSADATEQERYAADELRNYLELMLSASMPVGNETTPGPAIAIGGAASRLGVNPEVGLGDDGFTLRTVNDSLAIVGGRRGVIYGVYELLEKLGCRFFTPTCENIPSVRALDIPALEETQIPVLEYRHHNYADFTQNPRFAVKNRINGPIPIKDRFGGHMAYTWFVHTFNRILNPDEWFDTHPEYFSMVEGRRLRERTQLCLTHPDVLRITIDKVAAALRDHPEKRLISVSQNDWYNNCTCPDCLAIDQAEGSGAGSLIWFVNQVAEAIEAEFPQAIIDTLAYQYSRPAPRNIRPRHNVCVRLCSIEACFAHPLESCDDASRQVQRPDGSTSSFIRDLEDWGKVCDRVYIWDYTTCFAHYPAPHPNWNVLQPNMQSFVRNNVKGVFEQACGALGGSTDLNELRAYLIGKLLWNADCDYQRHMTEFTDHYYGPAAPHIREYIDVLTAKVEADDIHVGFNDPCNGPHLSEAMLDIYDEILASAAQAVCGDPIRAMRVDRARLSLRWVRLKNNAMLHGIRDPREINRFFADWRAHGLTRIDEWVSAETTHRALLVNRWRGVEFYPNWWDEGGEER